jgi:glycine/D-amino acid oxidase-like deaminating enzyme
VGLSAAVELGLRGISCLVVDNRPQPVTPMKLETGINSGHCIDFHRGGGGFQFGQLGSALECCIQERPS